jgi:hypothetical protein
MMRPWISRWLLLAVIASMAIACGRDEQSQLKELQRARAGSIDVVLLSAGEALHQGKNSSVLEFRAADGTLMDVGSIRVNATMPMAGMGPMLAGTDVRPTDVKGRYAIDSDFSMIGTWRFTVEWDGPAGRGTVSLPGTVR